MNTNSIPYFDEAVKWSESLMGAPAAILVFLLCIAVGYVWKMIRVLPNRFTPLVVMLTGAVLLTLMTWVSKAEVQAITRNVIVGFIIGFIAWLFHRLILKRLEDKFGVKLEEGDTAIISKPENKDNYQP